MSKQLFAVSLIAVLAACGQQTNENMADVVFTNAKIYTVNDEQTWAEAVAIKGDEIIYVGDAAGAEDFIGGSTEVKDVGGKLMLPGFIDSHTHYLMSSAYEGAYIMNIDGTPESWVQGLAEHAEEYPDQDVIFGFGWIDSAFGGDGPSRELLDAVVSDRPVVLRDEGFHALWVNTAALEAANVTADTPDPQPGYSYYKRDENGDATGYILEVAAQDFVSKIGIYSGDKLADGLRSVTQMYNSFGITSTFDAGITVVSGSLSTMEGAKGILDDLESTGDLTLRLVGSYRPENSSEVDGAIANAVKWREGMQGEHYRFDTIKLPYDGTIESRNAAMFEDFQGEPGNSGETAFTIDELNALVADSAGVGLDVHIHGLGERAVADALDAIERSRSLHPESETRYAICHVQVIRDEDVGRFGELGVVAQSSPIWAEYDMPGKQYVSDDQFNRFWRYKDLLDGGAVLSLGSDAPATGYGNWGIRPVAQIEVGHTRQHFGMPDQPIQPPESQRLSLEELVEGYTMGAAWQMHMEDEIGSVEVGKKADLIVLDQNIFEIDAYSIHKTEVVLTMMDGDVVYEMPDS